MGGLGVEMTLVKAAEASDNYGNVRYQYDYAVSSTYTVSLTSYDGEQIGKVLIRVETLTPDETWTALCRGIAQTAALGLPDGLLGAAWPTMSGGYRAEQRRRHGPCRGGRVGHPRRRRDGRALRVGSEPQRRDGALYLRLRSTLSVGSRWGERALSMGWFAATTCIWCVAKCCGHHVQWAEVTAHGVCKG